MRPHTRVDKIVWLRERGEDAALASLARARADVDRARCGVERARAAAAVDAREPGRIELWMLGEAGHQRAVRALRAAQGEAAQASRAEIEARTRYGEARRDALAVRRVQERRRAEARVELLRRDRRDLDEIAALRHAAAR